MIESRIPVGSGLKKQNKFLLSPFAALNLLNSGLIATTTKTNLVTITSTTSVASIQSCIGSAQFTTIAAAGQVPAVTFTQGCSRRRRWALADDELNLQEVVQPSPVQP